MLALSLAVQVAVLALVDSSSILVAAVALAAVLVALLARPASAIPRLAPPRKVSAAV